MTDLARTCNVCPHLRRPGGGAAAVAKWLALPNGWLAYCWWRRNTMVAVTAGKATVQPRWCGSGAFLKLHRRRRRRSTSFRLPASLRAVPSAPFCQSALRVVNFMMDSRCAPYLCESLCVCVCSPPPARGVQSTTGRRQPTRLRSRQSAGCVSPARNLGACEISSGPCSGAPACATHFKSCAFPP